MNKAPKKRSRKVKKAALVLAGRCMAHELEKRGIRRDLVEAWQFNAKELANDEF